MSLDHCFQLEASGRQVPTLDITEPDRALSRRYESEFGRYVQVGLWITAATSTDSADFARVLSCSFMALVSVLAAAGFLVYGGCLFNMLQK